MLNPRLPNARGAIMTDVPAPGFVVDGVPERDRTGSTARR
jgi:hypothetical protein